jgi:hypothetical protein
MNCSHIVLRSSETPAASSPATVNVMNSRDAGLTLSRSRTALGQFPLQVDQECRLEDQADSVIIGLDAAEIGGSPDRTLRLHEPDPTDHIFETRIGAKPIDLPIQPETCEELPLKHHCFAVVSH